MNGCYAKDEVEMIWKKAVVTSF